MRDGGLGSDSGASRVGVCGTSAWPHVGQCREVDASDHKGTACRRSPGVAGVECRRVGPGCFPDVGWSLQGKARKHVVRKYYRGPAIYRLKCGTHKWGYRHLVYKNRWSKAFSKKIGSVMWSGRRKTWGFSRYSRTCPSYEVFRVVWSSNSKGVITAYRKNTVVAAAAKAC